MFDRIKKLTKRLFCFHRWEFVETFRNRRQEKCIVSVRCIRCGAGKLKLVG